MLNEFFVKAKPVWVWERERDMNLSVAFKSVFRKEPEQNINLIVTAHSLYRFYVNGDFGGYGPVRAAHDYYRVDNWDITSLLNDGENVLVIEVAGYNANAFYVTNEPSFLQAEIVTPTAVIAATMADSNDFVARIMSERVQKVERCNMMRAFIEAYKFKRKDIAWRTDANTSISVTLRETGKKQLLPRRIAYPRFETKFPEYIYSKGTVQKNSENKNNIAVAAMMLSNKTPKRKIMDILEELKTMGYYILMVMTSEDNGYFMISLSGESSQMDKLAAKQTILDVQFYYMSQVGILGGSNLKSFSNDEMEVHLSDLMKGIKTSSQKFMGVEYAKDDTRNISANSFITCQFRKVEAGFLGVEVSCKDKAKFILLHDDILMDEDVVFDRGGGQMINAISVETEPGEYHIDCFEAHSFKYVKIIVLEGSIEVHNVYIREYANPDSDICKFRCKDEKLDVIFQAAKENLRHNTVDTIMDVTNRERASWSGDSLITAQGIFEITKNTSVETCFLENYFIAKQFDAIPKDMIPCVYPADQDLGIFIPNYAMMLVIQVEHFIKRCSGDRRIADAFKTKAYNFYNYLNQFVTKEGLLENLDGWIFVDWSEANTLIGDISFPTNMVYAEMLSSMGRMYKDSEKLSEADKVREAIRKHSFNGKFFVDNAYRVDGELQIGNNISEACQYYAYYYDIATPASYSEHWNMMVNEFGPDRTKKKPISPYPEILPAEFFMSLTFRLDLLSRHGYGQQMLEEIKSYYYEIAKTSGTIWPYLLRDPDYCSFGFQGFLACLILRHAEGEGVC